MTQTCEGGERCPKVRTSPHRYPKDLLGRHVRGARASGFLLGRVVLSFADLKPAKIGDVVSQGMFLAAHADNRLSLCSFDRVVPPGRKLR